MPEKGQHLQDLKRNWINLFLLRNLAIVLDATQELSELSLAL